MREQMNDPEKREVEPDEELLDDAGTLDDAVRGFLAEDEESCRAYLKESWLAAVMAELRRARQRAGLTQADLAERMGTKQPSIARLERAEDTTLGRLWDYLYACGEAPTEIETVPVAGHAGFVEACPSDERTASAVRTWLAEQNGDARVAGTGWTDSSCANAQPVRDGASRSTRANDV